MPQPAKNDTKRLIAHLADRDVPCPRCGYNLRGLTMVRCPECGSRVRYVEVAVGFDYRRATLNVLAVALGVNAFHALYRFALVLFFHRQLGDASIPALMVALTCGWICLVYRVVPEVGKEEEWRRGKRHAWIWTGICILVTVLALVE